LTVEHFNAGSGSHLVLAAGESPAQRPESEEANRPAIRESTETKVSVPDAGDASKLVKPQAPVERTPGGPVSLPAADKPAAPPLPAAIKPVPVAAENTGTVSGQAPSLIQRLEGREGDLVVWLAIAAVFFLAGWIGGGIHARRRERARRGRLRF
jgi:hypothetical protein